MEWLRDRVLWRNRNRKAVQSFGVAKHEADGNVVVDVVPDLVLALDQARYLPGAEKEARPVDERFTRVPIEFEQRPVAALLTSETTHVDESLARHYGMEDVAGEELRRVPVPDARRRGQFWPKRGARGGRSACCEARRRRRRP